ncbi:hypothetical protein EHI8A_239150 [Entamoeba histolytica HM-1:IMSS-B]|uniref:Uncharacterized protein n=6 Tax=Entamoeba histolytica TaxID=5759 RepID=B1N335_ENTH1|nr:hypothetical protein EHI_010280 [Entamoeba histolytica HM-1:IMSS]EMD43179.1 Hypothetical protein EHI5A_104330 [Entamoeba histolytica KU27]EMH75631.1 hypothetical protein EHI8A_239150 [Entamoeba histolytica HM-1:IMSS-B]EMS16917.1 hypothetical protein KM1_221620 [Entamoeba histolytica HM-3:IMSS]ENY61926.1 hypothetical protein EHI7A_200180 [Entamoeba histolytica HM-1:IMSS-A]GAT93990.1 hypothetical protein CL6EHI_010280 [Entamoeba histolytica]|eukprot:XP_001913601.1 hypothetical protein EHI_010280 [Entamoeba histolytica HM-1:IMSS]
MNSISVETPLVKFTFSNGSLCCDDSQLRDTLKEFILSYSNNKNNEGIKFNEDDIIGTPPLSHSVYYYPTMEEIIEHETKKKYCDKIRHKRLDEKIEEAQYSIFYTRYSSIEELLSSVYL